MMKAKFLAIIFTSLFCKYPFLFDNVNVVKFSNFLD